MVNQNLLPTEGPMPSQNVLPKEAHAKPEPLAKRGTCQARTSCQKRCPVYRWTLRSFFLLCELRQCQVVGTNALVHNNYKLYKCQYMCLCVSGFLFECSFCCLNVWFFWHCLVPSKLDPLSKGVPAWMQMPTAYPLAKRGVQSKVFLKWTWAMPCMCFRSNFIHFVHPKNMQTVMPQM